MVKGSHQDLHHSPTNQHSHSIPLCIDLDGSLINTDIIFESMAVAIRHLSSLKALLWLTKGKAQFKEKLAGEIIPNPTFLYHTMKPSSIILKSRNRPGVI
jgi:hypothetical protein